jgi:two-component system cell cycle sensor histidine kinase/response regulator CckA
MAHDKQRGTILVVDESIDICRFARIFLEQAGYDVVTAADGEEGLRFYQEHRSSIVLLLTDVLMPNIGGVELADRVLEMNSQLPVLFMSGDAWSAYRGLECIAKPFRPDELIVMVGRALSAKTQSIGSLAGACA